MSEFLQVKDIKVAYQTPDAETQAVHNVSFSVQKGQFVSLVGPSGCGKSTILSCMAGLMEYGGTILLCGQDIRRSRDKIGYMLQSDNLMPWRSIYRNVMLGLEVKKQMTAENIEYVDGLLKKYDLWQFRNAFPNQLSGGMRQRAALIRTLALRPQLLLLDEAFSALDYQTRVKVGCDVYGILRSEGKTMVMVTHDIPEAVSMSDKAVVLSKRPATVQKEVSFDFGTEELSPVDRRGHPAFQHYFNSIWRELTADEQTN